MRYSLEREKKKVKEKVKVKVKVKVKLMDKVKMKDKGGVKFFSASTWTLTCFLIFTLMFCLIPEDALAGAMSQRNSMLYMPKYSLWGDIALQYESYDIKSGSSTSHRKKFTQNYRLNFQSYVISPRLMYYTLTTGFNTGTPASARGAVTNYGIETFFLPFRPLNFSLRASRTGGKNYETSNYGIAATYTRQMKERAGRSMRAAPRALAEAEEENVKENVNINNRNKKSNVNAALDENMDVDMNENIEVPKPKRRAVKPPSSNLFSELLPRVTTLSLDRLTAKSGDSKTLWKNASLSFSGEYATTVYGMGFDYNNWKNDRGEHKGFDGDLETHTKLNWSFFQRFENRINFKRNDIKSYYLSSALSGSRKGRSYDVTADYHAVPEGGKTREFKLEFVTAYPFDYKGVGFNHSFNLGMSRTREKFDLWAGTTLAAHKRLGLNTDLNSALSITGGRLGITMDFRTGIYYTFIPRKGYTLRMELDPQSKTIKTSALKPQVYGWDYSIGTGYTFGFSKATGERRGQGWGSAQDRVSGAAQKAVTSHRGDLNIKVYLRGVNLCSDAVLYYLPDTGKNLQWNNSIYTTAMKRIGVTLGTGLIRDMPKGASRTEVYSIYNLITYSPGTNTSFNINCRYTKERPADVASLDVGPSVTWNWRKIFMNLDLRLIKTRSGSGAETKERRIMLKATRQFRAL